MDTKTFTTTSYSMLKFSLVNGAYTACGMGNLTKMVTAAVKFVLEWWKCTLARRKWSGAGAA